MFIFDFAQDFTASAIAAVAGWLSVLLNRIGAHGFVIRIFFVAIVVSMLILPLRGAGLSSPGLRIGGSDQVRQRRISRYERHKGQRSLPSGD